MSSLTMTGTCTIGMVMVSYFNDKPGELPGGDRRGPLTDVSTWRNICSVAQELVKDCVVEKRQLGWSVTGIPHQISCFSQPYLIVIIRSFDYDG